MLYDVRLNSHSNEKLSNGQYENHTAHAASSFDFYKYTDVGGIGINFDAVALSDSLKGSKFLEILKILWRLVVFRPFGCCVNWRAQRVSRLKINITAVLRETDHINRHEIHFIGKKFILITRPAFRAGIGLKVTAVTRNMHDSPVSKSRIQGSMLI